MATKAELVKDILELDADSEATVDMSHDELTELLKVTKELTEDELEDEPEAKTYTLTNNTKGLRGVCGHKLLPGKSVELSREEVVKVNANPCAMAWVKSGDLSLK